MSVHEFLQHYWEDEGWTVVSTQERQARVQQVYPADSVGLNGKVLDVARHLYPGGLYKHQLEAIRQYVSGRDVAIATGTASGKSAVFYLSAIDTVYKDPDARVLAIYPLKALAREQEARWREAFITAGLPAKCVARVDGGVAVQTRLKNLKDARCLIVTPDVVHAWLLPNVGEPKVWSFVRQIRMIVVDEVHTYSGVFGSNAAFLFRRLETLMEASHARATYVAASATIKNPAKHLENLTGRHFDIIDESFDTSGRYPLVVQMVNPPPGKDLMGPLSRLIQAVVAHTDSRFITFLDSRKQVESLASIAARSTKPVVPAGTEDEPSDDDDADDPALGDHLSRLDVLPYRAGFEEDDRAQIQERLSDGKLRGVISTSALELGINIADLEVGILVGVPRSTTSLQQRMGRVGRHKAGIVVIVNNGDLSSEVVFKNPALLFQRPLAESTLYLENRRIQYIHAMCLARIGGEYDQVCSGGEREPYGAVEAAGYWPAGFASLCKAERTGQIPTELQSMKMEGGETPHYVYPLRDVGTQFTIEQKQGPVVIPLGSITQSQLMREAYPGAIYYYATRPYRVYKVLPRSKKVLVRAARYYSTSPSQGPTMVYPNLVDGGLIQALRCGDLVLLEADAQIHEAVYGYEERRGSSRLRVAYPCDPGSSPVGYAQQSFSRYFFTTSVLLAHPALDGPGIEYQKLAELIYECFLVEVPLDRQDVQFACGKLKVSAGKIGEGTRFLAVYDQTYGSLRLSGRLMENGVPARVLHRAVDIAATGDLFDLNQETKRALSEIAIDAELSPVSIVAELSGGLAEVAVSKDAESKVRVIMPGSEGLNIMGYNCSFRVDSVFFSPRENQVSYRGHNDFETDSTVATIVPISSISPVPGVSKMGWYDSDTGELVAEG